MLTRKQEPHVLDRPGFANARRSIDKRARDPIAQAAGDKFVERFDRGRRQAVIARDERMQ
ncbi:hypothetical protein [Paraburkholderia hospita]|uniref:hypothetical protein n=1 Tax=Paraburkholderia hospita TaxID=169430 RepID=UPI0038993BD1